MFDFEIEFGREKFGRGKRKNVYGHGHGHAYGRTTFRERVTRAKNEYRKRSQANG